MSFSCGALLEVGTRGELDAAGDGDVRRALVRVGAQRANRGVALLSWHVDAVVDADLRDADDAVDVLEVALDLGDEPVLGADLARFQRAGKGAAESAGDRCDQVVERRRSLPIDLDSVLAPVE